MNKKKLNLLFTLCAAGILLLLAAVGVSLQKKRLSETPVVVKEAEISIVDIRAVEVTPAPTPLPALPEGAVTLLSDRRPVVTLESHTEAQRLLWEYLARCAVAPEGETLVSAAFSGELLLVNAEPGASVSSFEDALTLLTSGPSTVPVRLETLRTEYAVGEIGVSAADEPALAAGSRILSQIGAGALTRTQTRKVCLAGEIQSAAEPETTTLREARSTIVKNGTYDYQNKTGEPKKDEGAEGKSAGGLSLVSPMRGSISSSFGFRNGSMHNGMDVLAKAGTEIAAPGEGVVIYCGERGAYGFVVDIDHGNGFVSRLAHLSGVSLELNQRVFQGEALGTLSDAFDNGVKPHLHYELLIDGVPYNPAFYLG